MGQEIRSTRFTPEDFSRFNRLLDAETALLAEWFTQGRFSSLDRVGGFELEAWLIDARARPAARNAEFLRQLNNPLVVPELARFNVEVNGNPQVLNGAALTRMQQELEQTWRGCQAVAGDLGLRLLMIGTLPTLEQSDLTLANMSDLRRYRALNEQVLKHREGSPLQLDIRGEDHLRCLHEDVMLESATTSFQIHLKVGLKRAARYYNLSQILSAPMVAVSANSPYLFGRELWDETRIPLFEQSVEVGGFNGAAHGPVHRVSFGTGYVHDSLFECFRENREHFPVMLPIDLETAPETLEHLRLHNGTIWRWNRPLIGFDDDGTPHLRIEHRVVPSGPTITDSIANTALFYGLMQFLGERELSPELQLPFSVARDNFYAAARHGLDAQVQWLEGRRGSVRTLLLDKLLPMARQGLAQLDIDAADSDHYLGVIRERLKNSCNGAAWQRAWVARHGRDWAGLVEAYLERQESGEPVAGWSI